MSRERMDSPPASFGPINVDGAPVHGEEAKRPLAKNIQNHVISINEYRRNFEGRDIYVVNCTGMTLGTSAKVFLTFVGSDMVTTDLEAPITWLPWRLSEIVPPGELVNKTEFGRAVQAGHLRIINPNFAESLLDTDAAKQELRRLQLQARGADIKELKPEAKASSEGSDMNNVRVELQSAVKEADISSILSLLTSASSGTMTPLSAYEEQFIRRHISDQRVLANLT